MKSISFILAIFIGLGVCNAFGKVEYLPMPQNQSVNEGIKSETELLGKTRFLSAFNKLPLHFVTNQGQLDPFVVYYAKSEGATVYCTEEGLVFGFAEGSISLKFNAIAAPSLSLRAKRSNLEARGELAGKVNYFIGNDTALWRTNIPTFQEVVYPEVYPGIDLAYSGNQRRLKYTFYLQPNSHPNQIQMIYDGIEGVWVDKATGELIIQTEWGEMRDAMPIAYQEIESIRKDVDVSFRLMGENRVGFTVGDYNPNFMLMIDPGYSTYLGGSDGDIGQSITVDSSGNVYITGLTQSSDFPTQKPYQDSKAGGDWDAFVTKLNSSGSTLTYSTYLGGSSLDEGLGIAVDSFGNAYVAGRTNSSDFPTQNPFQSSYGGGNYDCFVTKLNSSGNALTYSTYIGGSNEDDSRGVAVDSEGNAYIAGMTESAYFPIQNPLQSSYGGGQCDAFVTKLNDSGNALTYSTYLGGNGVDYCEGIVVDSFGNVYVTGRTYSSNFPTQNSYDDSLGGGSDAFVTKLNSLGNELVYSTYIGGSDSADHGFGIAVDGSGNAYLTGKTNSSDFPTQNPFQDSHGGGNEDAFVTKLNSLGNALVYSTYIGGSGYDYGEGIAVDNSGNAYVTGNTGSSDFPTQNPFQSNYGGGQWDAFVIKLNSLGNELVYSTYIGGENFDWGNSIAVDSSGNTYVTGQTRSSDFPTQNPFQGRRFSGYPSDGYCEVTNSSFLACISQKGCGLFSGKWD